MSELGDRLRSEAAIADRPGQMARLEALAVEIEAVEENALEYAAHILDDVRMYGTGGRTETPKQTPNTNQGEDIMTDNYSPQHASSTKHRADGTAVHKNVSYVREQKGHSLILHLVFGIFTLWIPAIYYTVSKNHFWHV